MALWSERLGVSPQQLLACVLAFGPYVDDIERALRRSSTRLPAASPPEADDPTQ